MDKNIELLESQIRQMFASVVWTHKIQEKQADILRGKYNKWNTLKIIAASVTSAGIFSVIFVNKTGLKIAASLLSLVTLFIDGYFKAYDFLSMAETHKRTAIEMLKIRDELICLLCDIKMDKLSVDEITEQRDIYLNKMFGVYDSAKDASIKAVNEASKRLKNSMDNTFLDEEIDSFLPLLLRKSKNN